MKANATTILVAIFFASLALPAALPGRTLPADAIGMFPKNVDEFAYVDLREARMFPWFSQLENEILPARFLHFENFLASVGVNREGQIEEVAWASVRAGAASSSVDEDVVGIALGSFKPDSTLAYFQSEKLPVFVAHDLHFYGFGGATGPTDLVFGFLDSNTAAFGQRREVERLVAVRYGEEPGLYSNAEMAPLVTHVNGSGTVWMVLDAPSTGRAVKQLVPLTAKFPEARALFENLRALTIQINVGDEVEANFEAVCASVNTADTLTLSTLLQAGMIYQRHQVASSNPELAALYDSARVVYSSDRIGIRLALAEDQLARLVRQNAFAMGF